MDSFLTLDPNILTLYGKEELQSCPNDHPYPNVCGLAVPRFAYSWRGKKARPLEASDQKPLIVPQQWPRPLRPLDARSNRTLVLITSIHTACQRDPQDEGSTGVKEATRAAPSTAFVSLSNSWSSPPPLLNWCHFIPFTLPLLTDCVLMRVIFCLICLAQITYVIFLPTLWPECFILSILLMLRTFFEWKL